MSDNKLKIRIQLQQQPPKTIEQYYPDLSDPEITYEQVWDWNKIFTVAVSSIVVIAFVGYWLLGGSPQKSPSQESQQTVEHDPVMQHESIIAPAATELQSETIEPIIEQPATPSAATPENPVEQQSLSIDVEQEAIVLPRKKPVNRPVATTLPATIPRTAKKPRVSPHNPSAPPNPTESNVARAILTLGISDREPVDEVDTVQLYSDEGNTVYFFLQLVQLQNQRIRINWYHENQLNSHLYLNVHGDDWRTYASKQLDRERLGNWHVELLDQQGQQLATRRFTVTEQKP